MTRTWTEPDIKRQFMKALRHGWVPFFLDSAKHYGILPEVLMAIASRESAMQNIIGDHGHGHSLMQIDDRTFPAWCASGKWRDAQEAIRMGAFVLHSNIKYARDHKVPEKDLLQVAVEAYNDGPGRALQDYWRHQIDLHTTGHDYSTDVLSRAAAFKPLLPPDS